MGKYYQMYCRQMRVVDLERGVLVTKTKRGESGEEEERGRGRREWEEERPLLVHLTLIIGFL